MHRCLRSTARRAILAMGLVGLGGPALACNDESYIGTLCTFAFDWCPPNYLPADGREINVRGNEALFALIGYTYGGNSREIYKLPDLRGRVAVGIGTGPGLTRVDLGQTFGQSSLVLTAAQTPLVPHTHPSTFSPTQGTQTIDVPASPGGAGVSVNAAAVDRNSLTTPTVTGGSTIYLANAGSYSGATNQLRGLYTATAPASGGMATIPVTGNPALSFDLTTVTGGSVAIGTAAAPPSEPVSTQPPSLGMTVCIRTKGLFPNRP